MQSQNDAEKLKDRVTGSYHKLINMLQGTGNNAIVITPVQTVGCFQFAFFEPSPNLSPPVLPVFMKTTINAKHDPKDCDQPMLYFLRFMFRQKGKQAGDGWLPTLLPFLFRNHRWNQARQKFEAACKQGSCGFEVVAGENLL